MISNYNELQSAIQSWLTNSQAYARIPDFIMLAEGEMTADLDVQPMKLEQSVAFSAGASAITLPANMINPEELRISTGTNPDVLIRTREQLQEMSLYQRNYDATRVYGALVGRDLKLFPQQTVSGSLLTFGKCALPALSEGNPTNWLLTAFPNLYLAAALREAGSYLRDESIITWSESRYTAGIAKVNAQYVYKGQMGSGMPRNIR